MGVFTSVLRLPDRVSGATEKNIYRFEERLGENTVKYEYKLEDNCAKVIVYPSEAPVMFLKLRFRGDFSEVDKVYADDWARSSYVHPLVWKNVIPERQMPWFFYALSGNTAHCYGVKTTPNSFVSWYLDEKGVTLLVDLRNGTGGTDLKSPLVACEIVELEESADNVFNTASKFAKLMCQAPVLPKTPIFGVNNWYWAYGDITFEGVLEETDYLMEMTKGVKNKPYMIIDDGWQKHRVPGDDVYIGGEWQPNERFKDMKKMADAIHAKGAKAGLWFRPLLTRENLPEDYFLTDGFGGRILDPSNPKVLEKIEQDARNIREWGFDLIKHDFTQIDMFGNFNDDCEITNNLSAFSKERVFYDKTKTNATIVVDLYKAIAKGAGEADVIGCNTFSHLTAGIHSVYRVGGDTSGRAFEITRSDGINSMMRLPQNNGFYLVDPDCAAFTKMVNADLNLDFLEMCAITGVTTLASVTPGILTSEQMQRINKIFKLADGGKFAYGIANYQKTCCPSAFVSPNGKDKIVYDWYKGYDGVRVKFEWVEKSEN